MGQGARQQTTLQHPHNNDQLELLDSALEAGGIVLARRLVGCRSAGEFRMLAKTLGRVACNAEQGSSNHDLVQRLLLIAALGVAAPQHQLLRQLDSLQNLGFGGLECHLQGVPVGLGHRGGSGAAAKAEG